MASCKCPMCDAPCIIKIIATEDDRYREVDVCQMCGAMYPREGPPSIGPVAARIAARKPLPRPRKTKGRAKPKKKAKKARRPKSRAKAKPRRKKAARKKRKRSARRR